MQETEDKMVLRLEGRIAGPWVAELSRTWLDAVPRHASKKVLIDLCNVTYADGSGKRVLQDIYSQSGATLLTSTPWTEHLAKEISNQQAN